VRACIANTTRGVGLYPQVKDLWRGRPAGCPHGDQSDQALGTRRFPEAWLVEHLNYLAEKSLADPLHKVVVVAT